MVSQVFVGLGSNLDQPREQVERALQALASIPSTSLLAASSLYVTPPMGPQDQDDYVNAVAHLATGLDPRAMLEALFDIERAHERVRERRWGPRTLDLDLLLYDARQQSDEVLTLPHYGMAERSFVLVPLRELVEDDFSIPGKGLLGELIARLDPRDVASVQANRIAKVAPGVENDHP